MPSRRKDCFTPTEPLNPHNLLKSTSTVLPRTMPLPPLSKGGGLTARHKLLSCCVLIATHLPFYSLNFYAVKTEGLLYTHRTSQSPQPSQKHINRFAPHHAPASPVKGRWLDGKAQTVVLLRFNCDTSAFLFTKLLCRQDGRIALHPPSLSIPTTFSKAHQPFRPALNLPPLPKVRCCRPKKFGRLPEGLSHHPHHQ